jgi:hypothetical protein
MKARLPHNSGDTGTFRKARLPHSSADTGAFINARLPHNSGDTGSFIKSRLTHSSGDTGSFIKARLPHSCGDTGTFKEQCSNLKISRSYTTQSIPNDLFNYAYLVSCLSIIDTNRLLQIFYNIDFFFRLRFQISGTELYNVSIVSLILGL